MTFHVIEKAGTSLMTLVNLGRSEEWSFRRFRLYPPSLFRALETVATENFFFFANSVICRVGSFRKASRTFFL